MSDLCASNSKRLFLFFNTTKFKQNDDLPAISPFGSNINVWSGNLATLSSELEIGYYRQGSQEHVESSNSVDLVIVIKSSLNDISEEDEFKRISMVGEFDHSNEMLVGPRAGSNHDTSKVHSGNAGGYYIVTPFLTSFGSILVNRGFIPIVLKNDTSRTQTTPGLIEGWVRRTEGSGGIAVTNVPSRNEWYSLDTLQMSERVGCHPLMIELLNTTPVEEGWPTPRTPFVNLSNNHFQYAFTWWELFILGLASPLPHGDC